MTPKLKMILFIIILVVLAGALIWFFGVRPDTYEVKALK